ncbi:MAG: FkbM family methyltransferase [Spirochaetaceae bacterium]|jgi:FkbM family methyltransferase|nr:FkbM family methyltransferase [Spirochaetaceae bacterium]
MKGKTLLHRLQYWGYSTGLLRTIWRMIVPARLRKRIAKISTDNDHRARLKALTKMVAGDIENNTIDFDKAQEVLRFLKTDKIGLQSPDFIKLWFKDGRLDINGAFLPDITCDAAILNGIGLMFADTFLFHVFYKDNYQKKFVERLERTMVDGPNGYVDGDFDVSVKAGDTVIDAGAYIGDFGAYAAAKGAVTYAFEPSSAIYNILIKTSALNGNKIIPVQKGLSDFDGDIELFSDFGSGDGGDTIVSQFDDIKSFANSEKIPVTTLDKFAEEENLKRIDFIKADIEGAERNMLTGAKRVLKEFAPKLAICTYHLPDDPEVLEKLILEANPKYKVRQGPNKLYACVC